MPNVSGSKSKKKKRIEEDSTVMRIPEGLQEIHDDLFHFNDHITEVILSSSVVSIGDRAFQGCSRLKKVVFSEGLTRIGVHAFLNCRKLREVVLPQSLRELRTGAFAGCRGLKTFSCRFDLLKTDCNPFLPDGKIMKAGKRSSRYHGPSSIPFFLNQNALQAWKPAPIRLLTDPEGFLVLSGILFAYYGDSAEVRIPDGVKHIREDAFSRENCRRPDRIEKLSVPSSVESIGEGAFQACVNLKDIELPPGIRVGAEVFSSCEKLADGNSFLIRNGTAYAWYGSGETVTVPEGVKALGGSIFAGKRIRSAVLPEGLERIGDSAFENCCLLEHVSIPGSLRELGSEAFRNCLCLTGLALPDTVERKGKSIFAGCKALADKEGFVIWDHTLYACCSRRLRIKVPEGVREIEDDVFHHMAAVEVRLPSTLRRLGTSFRNCVALYEITIPEGVEELCRKTFCNCGSLKKIVLPESLRRIGDGAFEGCRSLTEVQIPQGVTEIGRGAFAKCTEIRRVCVPDGVSVLRKEVFMHCGKLEAAVLPKGLREIRERAFYRCSNLKEIQIPASVERIEYNAFYGCSELKTVPYSGPAEQIHPAAFENCDNLYDENGFLIFKDTLWAARRGKETIVVPEGVAVIERNAFREEGYDTGSFILKYKNTGNLKRVELPQSLREIRAAAFCGCDGLRTVVLREGLETIGDEAFKRCLDLEEIPLPSSVRSIGANAFEESKIYGSISLPRALVSIGKEAFRGCRYLYEIRIPPSVRSIGDDAFLDCTALHKIVVDGRNRYFSSRGGMLFDKSGKELLFVPSGKLLKSFTIPKGVTTIGRRALYDCSTLERITVPGSVKNIENEAFPCSGIREERAVIDVSPEAGSGRIGKNAFTLREEMRPLVYPRLPIWLVRDPAIRLLLVLGYCKNPELYIGAYDAACRAFANKHKRALLAKAKELDVGGVESYFDREARRLWGGYRPDLTQKCPTELQKVEILEETVRKGSPEDLEAVLETYGSFEMTARALALAGRYRGIGHVRVLLDHGAAFRYESSGRFQQKYGFSGKGKCGTFRTAYELMLVPEKLDPDSCGNTPLTGVSRLFISREMEEEEEKALPLADRLAVVRLLLERKVPGFCADGMLLWALIRGETAFAEALIGMGVDLRTAPLNWFSAGKRAPTGLETVASARPSRCRRTYEENVIALEEDRVLPVMEMLVSLAAAAGRKPVLSEKMLKIAWTDKSMTFVLSHSDFTRVNRNHLAFYLAAKGFLSALQTLAEQGLLKRPELIDFMISFARIENNVDLLAWLMEHKNRTVDPAAEAAKRGARLLRELSADPESRAFIRKSWRYRKLEDGTVEITAYRGRESEVTVPARIEGRRVSVIGEEAFMDSEGTPKAADGSGPSKITSVTVPEGVRKIGAQAFCSCSSLVRVELPETLREIGSFAFSMCEALKHIRLPESPMEIGMGAFEGCERLADENGLIIFNGILYGYEGYWDSVDIPAGVREIADYAFYEKSIEMVSFHAGLEKIGKSAFEKSRVVSAKLPKTVTSIGDRAFSQCRELTYLYIPETAVQLGEMILGSRDGDPKPIGVPYNVLVHTDAGSAAEKYMQPYLGVRVVVGFTEEEKKEIEKTRELWEQPVLAFRDEELDAF